MGANLVVTVEDKVLEFLIAKKVEGISEKTITTYQNHLNAILPMDKEWCEVSWNKVVMCIYERDVSDYSKASYLKTLKCFMRYYHITVNFKIKRVETVKETYTNEELKLLTKKPTSPTYAEWRTYAMVLLALDTGLRSGSMREIRVNDIQDNSVVIRHSKTGKVSILPYSKSTAAAIGVLKHQNAPEQGYLFKGIDGKQLSENAMKLALRAYCKKRNVRCRGWHCFRHTFAKIWVQQGGDPYVLQKMLMHTSMEQTRQYLNLFDADIKNAYLSPLETLNNKRISYKIKEEQAIEPTLFVYLFIL